MRSDTSLSIEQGGGPGGPVATGCTLPQARHLLCVKRGVPPRPPQPPTKQPPRQFLSPTVAPASTTNHPLSARRLTIRDLARLALQGLRSGRIVQVYGRHASRRAALAAEGPFLHAKALWRLSELPWHSRGVSAPRLTVPQKPGHVGRTKKVWRKPNRDSNRSKPHQRLADRYPF